MLSDATVRSVDWPQVDGVLTGDRDKLWGLLWELMQVRYCADIRH